MYPNYEWLPWKFSTHNYWNNIDNQREFLNWAAKQLQIKEMDNWYQITLKDYERLGGRSLLAKYKESPSLLLSSVYKDYEWLPWKFTFPSKYFWKDSKNVRKFMEWAGNQLGITENKDWYNVSKQVLLYLLNVFQYLLKQDLIALNSPRSMSKEQLLILAYPEVNWQFNNKSINVQSKKTQAILKSMLKDLFPQEGKIN